MKLYKNKNVLITGGLGMIGSSIAIKLVELGAHVTIVDAILEPYGSNYFNVKDIKNKIKFHKIDIRDKKKLIPLIENTDIIFNLAGQVSHNDSLKKPFLDADINYIGHLNILEIVKNVNPKIKVLYAGSRLQYGKINQIPVNESHEMNPLTPYALNKMAAESIYLYYHRMYNIPVVLFRIANPYGPRGQFKHSKYCMVNWFIRQAEENKCITIYGSGNQIRDYIYIDDLVDAYLKSGINKKVNGQVFNIGSGIGVKFKDMVKTIKDIVGMGSIKYIKWPKNYINVETGGYISDISKFQEFVKWTPKIKFQDGINRTFEFFKKYKKYYI